MRNYRQLITNLIKIFSTIIKQRQKISSRPPLCRFNVATRRLSSWRHYCLDFRTWCSSTPRQGTPSYMITYLCWKVSIYNRWIAYFHRILVMLWQTACVQYHMNSKWDLLMWILFWFKFRELFKTIQLLIRSFKVILFSCGGLSSYSTL